MPLYKKGLFMPIPWFAVLQSVPWADVIRNAPKVADGAKKLWSTIGKKSAAPEKAQTDEHADLSPEARAVADLRTRLAAVEATAAGLHEQMLASSELIKALAEQNAQLIKHIEANRIRVLWLLAGIVLVGALASVSLFLVYAR